MLKGILKGDLSYTKTINQYLNLCLNCGACEKICPSGIDICEVLAMAKKESLDKSFLKKFFIQIKYSILFIIIPNIINFFRKKYKSKKFEKKVLYFAGCSGKINGDRALIKILNLNNIEVINPNFNCCGVSAFANGDLKNFILSKKNFIKLIKKYEISDIITTCASCEKTLKSYIKWTETDEEAKILSNLNIQNIYQFLHNKNITFELKKPVEITYHKPCNINNFEDVEWIINNTKNLKYTEMKDFDKCCGLNGIGNITSRKIFAKISEEKHSNIIASKAKIVATSCFGCEISLGLNSKGKYSTKDLIEILANYS